MSFNISHPSRLKLGAKMTLAHPYTIWLCILNFGNIIKTVLGIRKMRLSTIRNKSMPLLENNTDF